MPRTVLRSAIIRPVRYSAKCRRWGSLAKRSPNWARASWTTWGNSRMPGMIRCPKGPTAPEHMRARTGAFCPFYRHRRSVCKTPVLKFTLRHDRESDLREALVDGERDERLRLRGIDDLIHLEVDLGEAI